MTRLFSVCLLTLLLYVGVSGSLAAPRSPRGSGSTSELSRDSRFTGVVRLPAYRGQLAEVMRRFSRAAKVRMLVRTQDGPDVAGSQEPDLILSPMPASDLAIAHYQEGRASEFLECLEIATNTRWVPVKKSWVLTETPDLAHLLQLSSIQLQLAAGHGTSSLKRFTPRQAELLGSRSYLLPGDLTVQQRRGLSESSDVDFITSGTIIPEARDLQGVYVQIEKTDNTSGRFAPYELAIVYPRRDGKQIATRRVPLESGTFPPLTGVQGTRHTPPAAPILPSAWPPTPLGPKRDQPGANPVLAKATAYRVGDVLSALQTAVTESKVNLVASTHFYYWPVRALRPSPTVAEVMEGVSSVTGGQWRRVGVTYVLQPHAALERVVQLSPEMRNEWLGGMLATVHQSLTARQREILAKDDRLLPKQLTTKQTDALKWAAALGYVSGRGTDLKGLALEQVSLEYEKADLKARLPASVRYLFPKRSHLVNGASTSEPATVELAVLPIR